MYDTVAHPPKQSVLKNSTAILLAFATAFFPRLLTYFGAPAPLNFVHFFTILFVFIAALATTTVKDRKQIAITWELLVGMGILFVCTLVSALVNRTGVLNPILQFLLQSEAFMLLTAIMAVPFSGERLQQFQKWIGRFAFFNLYLAIAQSILMPIGIYPRRGGTIQDNTAGVFASGGGSAGNYVSCTVSFYFAIYFFLYRKSAPLWMRVTTVLAALYQIQVSDSKQVFLALAFGAVLLVLSKVEKPLELLKYLIPVALAAYAFIWALNNVDAEVIAHYRNWTDRAHIYGPDGAATQTKLAAFRLIPPYYESFLNVLFGLGPGHTVTRLGGWMIPKYADVLTPLGVTSHPVSDEAFRVVTEGWIARESTIFFPMFTWAGFWGDLGLVGLGAYLGIGYLIWMRVCVDDFGRFMLLSTAVFGFILTQMEEPGHMLSVSVFLGLRWHEERERQRQQMLLRSQDTGDCHQLSANSIGRRGYSP